MKLIRKPLKPTDAMFQQPPLAYTPGGLAKKPTPEPTPEPTPPPPKPFNLAQASPIQFNPIIVNKRRTKTELIL